MVTKEELESWHPKLIGQPYIIFEGTYNRDYNCLAFSLDLNIWTWFQENWPSEIPRNLKLKSIELICNKYGYFEYTHELYEEGYDKVAIYIKNNYPVHICKQFGDMWRSKMGQYEIIEHELDWLTGSSENVYGEIALILKRKKI